VEGEKREKGSSEITSTTWCVDLSIVCVFYRTTPSEYHLNIYLKLFHTNAVRWIYQQFEDFYTAVEYFKKALNINFKSIPNDNYNFIKIYTSTARFYNKLNKQDQPLSGINTALRLRLNPEYEEAFDTYSVWQYCYHLILTNELTKLLTESKHYYNVLTHFKAFYVDI
jgi:tetratricopeptide (TPR) repeat protein